jgi:hypothetical protein
MSRVADRSSGFCRVVEALLLLHVTTERNQ